MDQSAPDRTVERFSEGTIEDRSVEPWSIVGLVLGLVSPVALIAPMLWLVPPLAILVSARALVHIRREASRIGRAAALAGLGLGVLFGIAPVANLVGDYLVLR